MNCPYCPELDLRECSCIKDKQTEIIDSITNIIQLDDKINELIVLNDLLIESSTRAYDAKFYIGRKTGINLINRLLIKIKENGNLK